MRSILCAVLQGSTLGSTAFRYNWWGFGSIKGGVQYHGGVRTVLVETSLVEILLVDFQINASKREKLEIQAFQFFSTINLPVFFSSCIHLEIKKKSIKNRHNLTLR